MAMKLTKEWQSYIDKMEEKRREEKKMHLIYKQGYLNLGYLR